MTSIFDLCPVHHIVVWTIDRTHSMDQWTDHQGSITTVHLMDLKGIVEALHPRECHKVSRGVPLMDHNLMVLHAMMTGLDKKNGKVNLSRKKNLTRTFKISQIL